MTRLVRRCGAAAAAVVTSVVLAGAALLAQGSTAVADPELQQARQSYDQLNFEAARDVLTSIVGRLSQREVNDAERRVLAAAYELRGRTLQNLRDQDGARADFRAMLMLEPGHPLPPEAGGRAAALFEEVRAATVGTVEVALTPADADVQIDGHAVSDRPLRVALVAGFHSVNASRPGHASMAQQFEVRAGESTTIPVVLVRQLTTLTLRTVPANVFVFLDGTARGVTQPDSGAAAGPDSASAALSQPLVIEELPNGAHRVEFRRDCFVSEQRQVNVQKPEDVRLDVVQLTHAVGTVTVRSTAAGAMVFVDDKERGPAPQSLEECQGTHVIDVRTRTGRDVRRVDVKTGSTDEFNAAVRPAFALVASVSNATGSADDVRLRAEGAFSDARTLTFFAPPKARVDEIVAAARVPGDWLAFDATATPLNGATVNASGRRTAGERLAQQLDAQGVAAVNADGDSDPRAMLLTLLAPGSARPDVLRWRRDDPDSVRQVIARLDAPVVLTRRSPGLLPLDVLDVQGIVVGSVDPGGGAAAAGLQPGDIVTAAGGRPVAGVSTWLAAVASAPGPQLSLDVRDRSGVVRKADVTVQTMPYVTQPSDDSVLANVRALTLTARLVAPATPVETASLRLNLASAWMRLENWEAATRELATVASLADGAQLPAGVKETVAGNAQYLLGVCAATTGDAVAAEQAWTKAAASPGMLLSEGGETLQELAGQRLAELRNPPAAR